MLDQYNRSVRRLDQLGRGQEVSITEPRCSAPMDVRHMTKTSVVP